jgi:RsiW-degrading membrane proteinase PrsW (M82 family)
MVTQYLLVFALGLAPSIVWLIFFDLEEAEKAEPISDIIYAFITGAVVTFAALVVQTALRNVGPSIGVALHSRLELSLFATIEEVLKFAAVYFLVSRRKSFNEPVDAMIYMITVALGFAAVENTASLINSAGPITSLISAKHLEIVVLRFLGATLLHCVASGIIGFHWAVGWVRGKLLWLHIVVGILIASLLHSVFNYLILTTGPATWALAFVVIIAFFVLIDFEELRTEEEEEEAQGVVFMKP